MTAFFLNMMVVIDVSYLLRPAERISGTLLRFWCQENLWKVWRPVQRLVVATENRCEDGLKNLAKVCKEGNVLPLDVSKYHRTPTVLYTIVTACRDSLYEYSPCIGP